MLWGSGLSGFPPKGQTQVLHSGGIDMSGALPDTHSKIGVQQTHPFPLSVGCGIKSVDQLLTLLLVEELHKGYRLHLHGVHL
jgi:hypothetical protein